MFAERLKESIDNNGITMYKVAKDLNLNKQTLINWATGVTEPKASEIRKLCLYLDVSANYLLELKEY